MLAHLVPLIGVVAFGWDLLSVLLLFWAESLFLGLVATVQALRAAGRSAIGTVLLFIVVFVALAAAHLMVIAVLAGAAGEEIPSALQPDRFAELPLFSALAAIYLAGLDWIVQQRPALLTVALPSLMLGHAIDAWMDGCMDAPSTEPPTHGRADPGCRDSRCGAAALDGNATGPARRRRGDGAVRSAGPDGRTGAAGRVQSDAGGVVFDEAERTIAVGV
jgi:hypothetical protein